MADGVQSLGRTNPWRIMGWGFAVALIAAPAVAMHFSTEVKWSPLDFLFAGGAVGATGMLIELAMRTSSRWSYRGGAFLAIAGAFLLIWINGAVGIIGDATNPANLLFLAVVAIGCAGAWLARGRPAGMSRAMGVAALAQALTGLAMYIGGIGSGAPPGTAATFLLIEFFAGLWFASALLFHVAGLEGR